MKLPSIKSIQLKKLAKDKNKRSNIYKVLKNKRVAVCKEILKNEELYRVFSKTSPRTIKNCCTLLGIDKDDTEKILKTINDVYVSKDKQMLGNKSCKVYR